MGIILCVEYQWECLKQMCNKINTLLTHCAYKVELNNMLTLGDKQLEGSKQHRFNYD